MINDNNKKNIFSLENFFARHKPHRSVPDPVHSLYMIINAQSFRQIDSVTHMMRSERTFTMTNVNMLRIAQLVDDFTDKEKIHLIGWSVKLPNPKLCLTNLACSKKDVA